MNANIENTTSYPSSMLYMNSMNQHKQVLNMNTKVVMYLIVPVGEGRGLIRWAMLSGMLMVRGEI